MEWYISLHINQRIWLKGNCHIITGIPFNLMVELFGFKESLYVIRDKMLGICPYMRQEAF